MMRYYTTFYFNMQCIFLHKKNLRNEGSFYMVYREFPLALSSFMVSYKSHPVSGKNSTKTLQFWAMLWAKKYAMNATFKTRLIVRIITIAFMFFLLECFSVPTFSTQLAIIIARFTPTTHNSVASERYSMIFLLLLLQNKLSIKLKSKKINFLHYFSRKKVNISFRL